MTFIRSIFFSFSLSPSPRRTQQSGGGKILKIENHYSHHISLYRSCEFAWISKNVCSRINEETSERWKRKVIGFSQELACSRALDFSMNFNLFCCAYHSRQVASRLPRIVVESHLLEWKTRTQEEVEWNSESLSLSLSLSRTLHAENEQQRQRQVSKKSYFSHFHWCEIDRKWKFRNKRFSDCSLGCR
jgi:hypothetical protein